MLVYFPTSEEKIIKALFCTPLLISPIVFEHWLNDRLIRFKNDKIEYLVNSKLKRSIRIDQISDIKRTADARYEYFQHTPLVCAALVFVYLILGCLVEGAARFVSALGFIFLCVFVSYFTARIFIQILGKRGKYRHFENIVVYGKFAQNFINILPKTDSRRSELKAYFLRKLGKNIDESGIKFFIFSIKSGAFGQIYPCLPALQLRYRLGICKVRRIRHRNAKISYLFRRDIFSDASGYLSYV